MTQNVQIKTILPYIQRAEELEKHDAVMSYFCRFYAVQLALEMQPLLPDTRPFLIQQMDYLETQKSDLKGRNELLDSEESKKYVEGFALRVFLKADTDDRAGRADKNTVRTFYVASLFLQVLKQFGPIAEEIDERIRYAQFKATDIARCLREGKVPVPGPPKDAFEDELENANDEKITEGADDTIRSTGDVAVDGDGDELPDFPTIPTGFKDSNSPKDFSEEEGPNEPDDDFVSFTPVDEAPSMPAAPKPVVQQPSSAPVGNVGVSKVGGSSYTPTDDDFDACEKYAKFAVNACQYIDSKSAILNLQKALDSLLVPPNQRSK